MVDDRNARIREQAYRLWQQEGEPDGRDREHWEAAERAFAGEGPVADEVDPQFDASTDATAAAAGAEAGDQPVATPPAPVEPAPVENAKPAAAKKPATRRKRTT